MSNKELKMINSVQLANSSITDKRDVELTFLKKLNEEYPLKTSSGVNEQGEKRNRTGSDDDHDVIINGSGTPKRTRSYQYKPRTIINSLMTATTTSNRNSPTMDGHNNHSYINQPTKNKYTSNNKFKVTDNAINYAVEQTLPNIRFECDPKIVDQKDGSCLIKELLRLIEPDYKKINPKINDAVGFETWFIDKNGDLICITRNIELLVFLCDTEHVPAKVLNTNIKVYLPKHLPPQRSIIIKGVPNTIVTDDVKSDLMVKYKSIYAVEDILGTNNGRSRYVRMDLIDQSDYNKVLNSGVICMEGQCLHVVEYLAAPRVLFCLNCNEPGHSRRQCHLKYERCKRCGSDKKYGEHKTCDIICHNCKGEHLSTDFKCPDVQDYRRDLIIYLQQHPETLPVDTQLFIPSQYRQKGVKTIDNRQLYPNNSYYTYHQNVNTSNGEWPILPPSTRSTTSGYKYSTAVSSDSLDNIQSQMKQMENACNIAKEEYNRKNSEIKSQVKSSIVQMQSLFTCFSSIIQKQNETICLLKDSITEILEYNCTTNQALCFIMTKSNDQQLVEMSKHLSSFPINARKESIEKIFSSYTPLVDDFLKKLLDATLHLNDNYG